MYKIKHKEAPVTDSWTINKPIFQELTGKLIWSVSPAAELSNGPTVFEPMLETFIAKERRRKQAQSRHSAHSHG